MNQLIYIPQDAHIRKSSEQCIFLIRTRIILANGFQIPQREVSRHGRGVWKTSVDGIRLTLNSSKAPLIRGANTLSHGALLFINVESKDKFALTLEAGDHGIAGVNIIALTGVSPMKSVLKSFYDEQSEDELYHRQDRVSKSLSSGLLVSAVMVKKVVAGEILYVIDVIIGK